MKPNLPNFVRHLPGFQPRRTLFQTARFFVSLGNPISATYQPWTDQGQLVRTRTPGGSELSQPVPQRNPGVTSGGGSNPTPSAFNLGIDQRAFGTETPFNLRPLNTPATGIPGKPNQFPSPGMCSACGGGAGGAGTGGTGGTGGGSGTGSDTGGGTGGHKVVDTSVQPPCPPGADCNLGNTGRKTNA